jgi:Type III flagellar switch regulator (C-ring) FliN C-term
MSPDGFIRTTSVTVDAVLARVRMPVESVAALAPGDRLDIEAQGGAGLLVRLVAEGQTIAVAALEIVDGQLIATILNNDANNGPGVAGRRIDQWKHRKAKTTA